MKFVILAHQNKPNFDWISIFLDFQTVLEAKKRQEDNVERSSIQRSGWSRWNPE
jgi:hypothetical protein